MTLVTLKTEKTIPSCASLLQRKDVMAEDLWEHTEYLFHKFFLRYRIRQDEITHLMSGPPLGSAPTSPPDEANGPDLPGPSPALLPPRL